MEFYGDNWDMQDCGRSSEWDCNRCEFLLFCQHSADPKTKPMTRKILKYGSPCSLYDFGTDSEIADFERKYREAGY